MLGRVCWTQGRKIQLEQECLQGLPVLALRLPIRIHDRERRIRKGIGLLREQRVTRVLTPPGETIWPTLLQFGLRPVDTVPLRCALAPMWVTASLKAKNVAPEQANLILSGTRESPDMEQVARMLCPTVRNLTVDVPGGGALAVRLRREFGLPVFPVQSARPDLVLRFESGPVLEDARFALKNKDLPADCEVLPLLAALWECGRVKTQEIVLCV